MSCFLVEAGEKMGLQITVLLSMIIYVEILQSNIPVFDEFHNTPLLLTYFIITILIICFCQGIKICHVWASKFFSILKLDLNPYYSILVSTYTLFLYHTNEYESKNFSKTEAKISLVLANMSNYANFKIWKVRAPEVVVSIANHPGDDIHKGTRFFLSKFGW